MEKMFDTFPHLESDRLVIRKMEASDLEALAEITSNPQVYRYIPLFLYQKSRGNLLAAIRNLGGRDFEKKKAVIAGIYLKEEPARLIGLSEMFDYKVRTGSITVGYVLNAAYWHRGIATEAAGMMREYLSGLEGIKVLNAHVMPENVYSGRVLLKNGFVKQPETVQDHNWGGRENVTLEVYRYEVGNKG